MTPEQFVYWLQGKLERRDPKSVTKEEIVMIQDHLKKIFHKVTPVYYDTTSPEPPPNYTGDPFGQNKFIC